MSLQRKRGQTAKVYKTKVVTDNRGNETKVVDMLNPYTVRAAFIPDRSAKAEVPGQQKINVYTMLIRHDLEDIELWSRVEWVGPANAGPFWDIVTPPAYHQGSRHTRHWTLAIRERPDGGA